jgi:hypothetical protein
VLVGVLVVVPVGLVRAAAIGAGLRPRRLSAGAANGSEGSMITRPGMSCDDCGLTDTGMHAGSANDDAVDPYSAAELMGTSLWLDYIERWNPLRWVPAPKAGKRKRRSA